MSVIFPDLKKTRVVFPSNAEREVYERVAQLGGSWRAYYSCTLSRIEKGHGLQENEIDFVLYHPTYGIFVVEVKGGEIRFDPKRGEFTSRNQFGKTFIIKNPFQQALHWKSRFLRQLKAQNIKAPVSHCVVFPSALAHQFPKTPEIDPILIIGMEKLRDLDQSLQNIALASHPQKFLNFSCVAEPLDGLLRGAHFFINPRLRQYIDQQNHRVRDIEQIHATLVNPLAAARRVAVEGEAGTGKTMLAVMLARKFRDEGLEVLLLSSNPLLNASLAEDLGSGIQVKTYPELAKAFGIELLRRPKGYTKSRDDWVQFDGPDRLRQAIRDSKVRYDVVICDESQDVQPFWWEAFEGLLRGKNSHLLIFFDRSQGVFGSGGAQHDFVPEDVLPVPGPYFYLIHNYRTTIEIASFSRRFRTGKEILSSYSQRLGFKPELIGYRNREDFQSKLAKFVDQLVEQDGLKPEEITVLSGRAPEAEESVLKGMKSVSRYSLFNLGPSRKMRFPREGEKSDCMKVSTIASFKGLETSVALLCNLSEYNLPLSNPIMASLLYVAVTRARHHVVIFLKEGTEKFLLVQQALAEMESVGGLLHEEALDLVEAEVVSFDPDRIGFLKRVDGREFESQIAFFPRDIPQSLGRLKAGDRVVGRIYQLGRLWVARDLMRV